ncbi:MAG TPA: DNA polymerase III subunit delta [Candidatus Aquilonibacter sp.]|nr:DNA polymerase III subunit delta [Candidatus Aquilonibacter sp.]
MSQSPGRFLEQISRGKAVPAIVLQGTDSYLLDMCRKEIVDAYVPEGLRDWALTRVSAREAGWEEVVGRARMLPMLAERQVIFVEDVDSVERMSDKGRDEVVKLLGDYLDAPAPFTILVLEAKSLDSRLKLSKLLAEKALIVELEVTPEAAAALAEQMAAELGTKIDRLAAARLAEMVNGEPARIRTEIEKLAAYTQGTPAITQNEVDLLVVSERRNKVWDLTDMLASGRREAAFTFLENLLREGEQPPMIVGALAGTYRRLIEACEIPVTTNKFQAAQRLRMPPDAAEIALRNAHRLPKKRLLAAITALANADSQLKSSNSDPRALLEFLLVEL